MRRGQPSVPVVQVPSATGTIDSSFLSLVPYETNDDNSISGRNALAAMALSDGSDLSGPASGETRVGCLTCHRAHASGWRSMLRWNNDADFIVYDGAYPGTDNGAPAAYHRGRTAAEARRAYYNRDPSVFATNQKRLCEKCHDGGVPP